MTAAPGDTLSGLLTTAGLDRNAAQQAVAALRPFFNPRDLRAGQEVIIHFGQLSPVPTSSKHADDEAAIDQEEGAQGSVMDAITALLGDWRGRSAGRRDPAGQPERIEGKSATDAPAPLVEEPSADEPADASDEDSRDGLAVLGFTLRDGETREIHVVRTDDGFAAQEGKRKLERRILLAEGTIRTSFYVAATGSGVPPSVVANAIRALSFDVDFQREIQEGNRYQFLYDVLVDADSGALVRGGDLLFIGMALDSRVVRLYRHRPSGFPAGYFDAQGKSAKRALMRTPIDGARLTSGYGMRRHPVLGFSTMHRGIDFAAPVGTPVYAAGAGQIEKAGWFAAYGRYVRILHEGRFATAYAHLHRIPDHIQEGRRVRQGDVIGYVGASGRATGPHLHYEVLRDGVQVNPALMRMPTVAELSEQGLAAFHAERERIDAALESVAGPTLVSGRADGDGPARRVVMVRVGDL
ncbi:MAG: M23 family metallopeptidase [Alphaproteobacteria bacterium]|nr:M23 family metallopeptidase [Alphaproteobacteria bacterium]